MHVGARPSMRWPSGGGDLDTPKPAPTIFGSHIYAFPQPATHVHVLGPPTVYRGGGVLNTNIQPKVGPRQFTPSSFCPTPTMLSPQQPGGSLPSLSTQASSSKTLSSKRGRADPGSPGTDRFRRSSRPRRPAPEKAQLLLAETPRVEEELNLRSSSVTPIPPKSTAENRHTRHASLDTLTGSRRKPPSVPLLALNKISKVRDTPSAARSDSLTQSVPGAASHVRLPSLSLPTRARPPNSSSNVLRADGHGFESFSDDVRACAQPLLQTSRVPAHHKQVYREWLAQALAKDWIEEVDKSRCHILLKPKFLRRPDGSIKFIHDCGLANAMATREPLPSNHQTPEVIHHWARTVVYLGRIELSNAALSIPLSSSQRKYYAFVGETGGASSSVSNIQFFRYKRMPPQAQGASRYLQLCITRMLDRMPSALRRRVMFRNEEIFCGGSSASECEEVMAAVRKWLDMYDFKVSMCKGIDTPVTACLGLLHDRQYRCLHIAEQRLVQIASVIGEMRTVRWVEATTSLLGLLSPITSILPPEWRKECVRLRKLVANSSRDAKLPSTVYLLWDQWSREAADWEIRFTTQ